MPDNFFELPLPGPYHNTSGGPVDFYYLVRTGVTTYRAYESDEEACVRVPESDRLYRTVNVAGVEKWWLAADLSNAGLVVKTVETSGSAITKLPVVLITPSMIQPTGAVWIPMPAEAAGIFGLQLFKPDASGKTNGLALPIWEEDWQLDAHTLKIAAIVRGRDGNKVSGYYYK